MEKNTSAILHTSTQAHKRVRTRGVNKQGRTNAKTISVTLHMKNKLTYVQCLQRGRQYRRSHVVAVSTHDICNRGHNKPHWGNSALWFTHNT